MIRIKLLGMALLLAACQGMSPEADPPKREPDAAKASAPPQTPKSKLPDRFILMGVGTIEVVDLSPQDAWRQLGSRLTMLQADARRLNSDVLISFEPDAVHVTRRDGSRTTWSLPAGLRLEVVTPHVVARNDLTLVGFLGDGTPLPASKEIAVVVVHWPASGAQTTESRLIVKGGKAFRSMTPG